jgi:hypothetical protein
MIQKHSLDVSAALGDSHLDQLEREARRTDCAGAFFCPVVLFWRTGSRIMHDQVPPQPLLYDGPTVSSTRLPRRTCRDVGHFTSKHSSTTTAESESDPSSWFDRRDPWRFVCFFATPLFVSSLKPGLVTRGEFSWLSFLWDCSGSASVLVNIISGSGIQVEQISGLWRTQGL